MAQGVGEEVWRMGGRLRHELRGGSMPLAHGPFATVTLQIVIRFLMNYLTSIFINYQTSLE